MRVRLRNPDRQVELDGPRSVREVLTELAVDPDTVLVIRDRTLLTREERLAPPADEQVARELAEEVLPIEVYGR
jgi:sulfur carrier protein ThiS